ncbi:MAG TPA: DUF4440 domain-containing protein [Pyrinomonadaceae bacterium]|nr:DUF4440 domain-containing protein [Pyrinomonadaceae bacterium]
MKRCPTCNKTFTDQKLSFCIEDGTPLAEIADPADETTVVSPPAPKSNPAAETEPYVPRDWQRDYQPPGSFDPPGQKRRVWPWVVGILGALLIGIVGLGIALALMVPKVFSNRNANPTNANVTRNESQNSNANSNAAVSNSNTNSDVAANRNGEVADDASSSPPTVSAEVLSDLTDIEQEWTVANINADKRKLDYILADDYVGTTSDGKSQGKAEYLKTIERDTVIEKWDFEDLKVSLRGDRATLTGRIRLRVKGEEVVYSFTDKFVWRDGRWQAVGSEIEQVQ